MLEWKMVSLFHRSFLPSFLFTFLLSFFPPCLPLPFFPCIFFIFSTTFTRTLFCLQVFYLFSLSLSFLLFFKSKLSDFCFSLKQSAVTDSAATKMDNASPHLFSCKFPAIFHCFNPCNFPSLIQQKIRKENKLIAPIKPSLECFTFQYPCEIQR